MLKGIFNFTEFDNAAFKMTLSWSCLSDKTFCQDSARHRHYVCLTLISWLKIEFWTMFSEFHRSNWWLPLKWSIEVITSARDGELIKNPPGEQLLEYTLSTIGKEKYLNIFCSLIELKLFSSLINLIRSCFLSVIFYSFWGCPTTASVHLIHCTLHFIFFISFIF